MNKRSRYLIRFLLLSIGFALTTMGILAWQKISFRMDMWPLTDSFAIHPVHLIVFGLALIPPTLWEIFVLEQRRD